MSECVVRMEMPTENTVCELTYYSNGYREWRCTITDKRCNHNKNREFPSWCPILCSLPEGHGRLIDWDALEKKGIKLARKVGEYRTEIGIPSDELFIVPAERSET